MDTVRVEDRDGARFVTLARPPLNVLDLATIRQLHAALAPLTDRRDLKAVVLRSAIDGAFSAGVDVEDHLPGRAPEMLETFHEVFRLLDTLPQATLAAVDGVCLGGGCELAVFCDVVLATSRSRFGQPEIDVGCFPPVATAILPRLVGRAAYELILGGAPIPAAEAARIGLINRVVDDLDREVGVCVERLTGKSAAVLALARKALRQGDGRSWRDALRHSEDVYRRELLATADAEEGVRAFLERRTPRWTDG
jgi:cyclohexa-1,5-dienecarbonyl-CoA hydratase